MEILHSYDLKLDPTIQNLLDTHIILPEMNYHVTTTDTQQILNLHDSQLELDPEMILIFRKSMTWKVLQEISQKMQLFVNPIWQELDFLVYFYLRKSKIFNNHLQYQINKVSVCAQETMDESIMSNLSFDFQQLSIDSTEKLKEVIKNIYINQQRL